MTASEDLNAMADQMAGILSRFRRTSDGVYIAEGDQAKFTGLILEARDLLGQTLGPLNTIGLQLEQTRDTGTRNFTGSQSYHSVEQAIGIVRSAANVLQRRMATAVVPPAGAPKSPDPYVSLSRINELRTISSKEWDLRRLVRLCEELNSCFAAANYLASAMVLRTVANHVPPIFGVGSFAAYASSLVAKSHKGSMERLQGSLRHIADGMLHQPIRAKESLPTATQVDFRQDLDVLLGEVVRVLR